MIDCKKCGTKNTKHTVFFTIYSRQDFCISCIAEVLDAEGIHIFSSRGPDGIVIHNERESTYIWNELSSTERQKVAKILTYRLNQFRNAEDMTQSEKLENYNQELKAVETQKSNALIDEDFFKEFYGGLMDHLNGKVIGQSELKRKMCYVFSRYLAKITTTPSIDTSNMLIVGASGTGKTETVRVVREYLKSLKNQRLNNIPFIEVDASALAPSSYKGLNVSDGIFKAAMGQVKTPADLEKGVVVYLDEFDKLFSTGDSQKMTVAQEILKIMEGGDFSWVERDMSGEKTITVNTSNFLFICSGAFTQLTNRINTVKKNSIGFSSKEAPKTAPRSNTPSVSDLVKYGVPSEVLGRLPIKTRTHTLSEDDYYKILTEVKGGVLEKGETFLKAFGVDELISRDLLRGFAKKASQGNLGARELKTLVEVEVERLIHEYVNRVELEVDEITSVTSDIDLSDA